MEVKKRLCLFIVGFLAQCLAYGRCSERGFLGRQNLGWFPLPHPAYLTGRRVQQMVASHWKVMVWCSRQILGWSQMIWEYVLILLPCCTTVGKYLKSPSLFLSDVKWRLYYVSPRIVLRTQGPHRERSANQGAPDSPRPHLLGRPRGQCQGHQVGFEIFSPSSPILNSFPSCWLLVISMDLSTNNFIFKHWWTIVFKTIIFSFSLSICL